MFQLANRGIRKKEAQHGQRNALLHQPGITTHLSEVKAMDTYFHFVAIIHEQKLGTRWFIANECKRSF